MTTRVLDADREPDELLRRAQEGAYRLPAGFAGFVADVACSTDRARARGTVRATGPAGLELALVEGDGVGLHEWARRELASMVGHRWAQSYDEGDGRWAKRLGEEDSLLAGRLVALDGDAFSSSYRLAAGQVVEVNRQMGGARFSIVIHARGTAPDGRSLPAQFSVFHWAADTGRLVRTDSVTDTFVEVGGVALPASRRVVRATDGGLERRALLLSGHAVLGGGQG